MVECLKDEDKKRFCLYSEYVQHKITPNQPLQLSPCWKGFSHLSGHELAKARREGESGDQQGDECWVHQTPDRERRTAGSLMGVLLTVNVHAVSPGGGGAEGP